MLSHAQKKHLKGLAHHLQPVIIVGDKGITEPLLTEFRNALDHHELLKVRINAADRDERARMVEALIAAGGAELVQRIGHVATLWRRNPERPRVELPKN